MSEANSVTSDQKLGSKPVFASRFLAARQWRCIWFAYFVLAVIWTQVDTGSFGSLPGRQRDEVYFDNIAFNLAAGHGYELRFSDPEWLAPYAAEQQLRLDSLDDPKWITTVKADGPTTSRPPVYPVILSAVYKLFGRQWVYVRWLQIIVFASSMTFLSWFAARETRCRLLPWLMIVTLGFDTQIMQAPGRIMNEVLAIAAISVLIIVISQATRSGKVASWLVVGLMVGMTVLVRTQFSAWLVMGLGVMPLLAVSWLYSRRPLKKIILTSLAFLVGVGLVAGPWWVRNCKQAEAFEPFGSAGRVGWLGGYSDTAYQNWGNWSALDVNTIQSQVTRAAYAKKLTQAQREHRIGDISSQRAISWVSRSFGKIPNLVGMKILNHLGLINQRHWLIAVANGVLLVLAVVGCWLIRGPFSFWIVMFWLMSIVTTGLTWSEYGRYAIPIRPFLHVACAYAVIVMVTQGKSYFAPAK